MGIESINSKAATNTAAKQQNTPSAAAKQQNAPSAAASKSAAKADADNIVRVEAMDGENTQAQDSTSANSNASPNANVNANINGYTNKDTRTADEKKAAENERIQKAIERMNAQLPNSEIKFGIHEKTDRVMIKLLDKETKEVIKEFPPEKTLDMIAKCMEIAGVLLDEKL